MALVMVTSVTNKSMK